jgi:hypothetical protein
MPRNFLAGLIGAVMLLVIMSAAGVVGAQSRSDLTRDLNHNAAAPALSVASTFSNTFTYQGQLKNASGPITGLCDIVFSLYDDPSAGSMIGAPFTPTVAITNGLFTQALSFGTNAFNGQARWLELRVKCGADVTYTTLSRQALTAAPYALALPGFWTQPNATSPNIIGGYSGNTISPTVFGGTIGGGGASGYLNSIQSPASFATIGGGWANIVGGGDATIGGGYANHASGDYATIGGGRENHTAGGADSTIGGGRGNVTNGFGATVGGGYANYANSSYSTIGGGDQNTAIGDVDTISGGFDNSASGAYSTIGGGSYNAANGFAATIPGGYGNFAAGDYSFAAGRYSHAIYGGDFVWADTTSDSISPFEATGPNQFLVLASGGVSINSAFPANAALRVAGGTSWFQGNSTPLSPSAGQGVAIGFTGSTGYIFAYDYSTNAARTLALNGPGGTVAIGALGSGGSNYVCLNGSNEFATCSSSLRYKNNVSDLPLGLDAVAKLRPVTFNWKDSGQADLGFVAEDVNKVTPLLTTLNQDGQIEGVKYDRITAVLVKGMQEQQQQIAELKATNSQLAAQVAQLQQNTTPASFNSFNLISVIALIGFAAMWLQQRRSRQGDKA